MANRGRSGPGGQAPAGLAVLATGVTRGFQPGRGVLCGLDLSIAPGEFVALLGRSGTGKSTLLRILGGLDPEYGGDVLVPERRAVVFQEPRLIRGTGPAQRDARPSARPGRPRAGLRRRSLGASARSGSPATPGRGRPPCPAVRHSGSRWPGRWCGNRSSCCWTNRSARSTR